jgi:CRISPR/Cas system endoribonuclease Cas6 (RAMP superfamily)
MTDTIDIDNIRYSYENQEFFQRQLEEAVNTLINKNNEESNKVFHWFIN